MATATFYNFSKRTNSTAVPSGGTAVNVVLKDGCSLLDPVFLLELGDTPTWSYMEFEDRYYKIMDIVSVKQNLWQISASVDVLATWKANILAASAFVAYDTTANTEITDRRLSIKTSDVVAVQSSNHATLGKGSCAVVSITGTTSTRSWVMDVNDATYLLDDMDQWLDNTNVLPIPDVTLFADAEEIMGAICENLVRIGRQFIATGKASDSIKSAFILPVAAESLLLPSNEIYLGQYKSGKTHKYVTRSTRIVKDILNVQIPWQATDWRRNAPYHDVYLHIPYLGIISLPPNEIMGETSVSVETSIDIPSGNAIFRLYTSKKTIGQYTTNLAAPFPIGASNVTPIQSVSAIGAAAAAAGAAVVTGGGALAAVAAGSAGIVGVTNNLQAVPTCVGSNAGGAVLGLPNQTSCIVIYHDTNVAPDSVSAAIGTPAMEVKNIGSLSGYVETRNFSVAGNMTDRERTEINRYMDGGVYIE